MTTVTALSTQIEAKVGQLKLEYKAITEELAKTPIDLDEVNFKFTCFKSLHLAYTKLKEKYVDACLKDNLTVSFTDEETRAYLWLQNKVKLEMKIGKLTPSTSGSAHNHQHLPKREIKRFNGDVREWRSFWAAFSDIHVDVSLTDMNKFNLLVQHMEEDSPAYQQVTSFPRCPENYKPAVESLQQRFGRESLLVKVYVRDLLQLAFDNNSGKRMDFTAIVTLLTSQIRNLEQLGVTKDKCAQILYPVVETCIPEDVLTAWQRDKDYKEDLDVIMEFLQNEVNNKTDRALAHSQLKEEKPKSGKSSPKVDKKKEKDVATASTLSNSTSTKTCVFCDGSHESQHCGKATSDMNLKEREEAVKSKHRCFQCLKPSSKTHYAKTCKAFVKCVMCGSKHYHIMCPEIARAKESESKGNKNKSKEETNLPSTSTLLVSSSITQANSVRRARAALQVLKARAYGKRGMSRVVRVFFDSGSQGCYVTNELAKWLAYNKEGDETVEHELFSGQSAILKHKLVTLFIAGLDGSNMYDFLVSCTPKIAGGITPYTSGPWIEDFEKFGITFTDLNSETDNIDVLIGNDIGPHLFTGRKHTLEYGPVAEETKWGWVLGGKLPTSKKTYSNALNAISMTVLDRPLSDLFSLETIGIKDSTATQTREEMDAETQKHFESTVKRLPDGRYEVDLPFLSGMRKLLPTNYDLAVKRLKSTTTKLQKDGFLNDYNALFDLWKLEGMIEEVAPEKKREGLFLLYDEHYLPHRAVVKLSSATTPIRPVFDASAKTRGKFSLNECLEKGPNTLELIPDLLLKFRHNKVGVTADIKKAFQQISVAPHHRDYLRFLWWSDPDCQKLKVFRHTRVVFGVTSSPFLLGATLKHHLKDYPTTHEETAGKLASSFYVDNCLISLSSMKAAEKFRMQSDELLLPAKFELRGWEIGPNDEDKNVPILGLIWNKRSDTISIDMTEPLKKMDCDVTPRNLLSLAHMLFDPLGFIAPFTLIVKFILRQCHKLKLGWDCQLPEGYQAEFRNWINQFPEIQKLHIPRYVGVETSKAISLHAFGDASKSAFAAVLFLRVETLEGVKVYFQYCKPKVAPMKEVTIPRLELLASLITARLTHAVKKTLPEDITIYYWSDSTTALAWIQGDGPWQTFVHNRVQEIRKLTKGHTWRHVPGNLNPADSPSRGQSIKKLLETKWINGPEWLYQPEEDWPSSTDEVDPELVEEERKKTVVSNAAIMRDSLVYKFLCLSDFDKIIKRIALLRRLFTILREKVNLRKTIELRQSERFTAPTGKLSLTELAEAERIVIRAIQQPLHHHLADHKKLQPFVDQDGIMRIKTRLFHKDDEAFLTPILLPQKDSLVELLIYSEHVKDGHAGTQILLSNLREKYWIIHGRRSVRAVTTKCPKCRLWLAKRLAVPEPPLPSVRTSTTHPFATTGVDVAGPLILKGGKKVWVVLNTCAVYRGVHLEVIDTMSTEVFLHALRRFIARRGRPQVIYSDNGLNFVGAANMLREIKWEEVLKYATVPKIEWRFNPLAAPWYGGWWERLIGLLKNLLRRILGRRAVRMDELVTFMCEVEEVMNSRPLTYVSDDPDDLIPLTPNHFIRNAGQQYFPEVEIKDAEAARNILKKIQRVRDAFRSRFRKEYLGFLANQRKNKDGIVLKPGDVVIVELDNSKRLDWPLGVITETVQSKRDGFTRIYRIKTRSGIIERPAQRLYPLEIQEE